LLHVRLTGRREGDAHPSGDEHLAVVHTDRCEEQISDPATQGTGRGRISDVLTEDDELVAPQAGEGVPMPPDGVVGAEPRPEASSYLYQHHVTGGVAEPVVDPVELVDSNDH